MNDVSMLPYLIYFPFRKTHKVTIQISLIYHKLCLTIFIAYHTKMFINIARIYVKVRYFKHSTSVQQLTLTTKTYKHYENYTFAIHFINNSNPLSKWRFSAFSFWLQLQWINAAEKAAEGSIFLLRLTTKKVCFCYTAEVALIDQISLIFFWSKW